MSSKISRIISLAASFKVENCTVNKLKSIQNEIANEMCNITSQDLHFNQSEIFAKNNAPIMYVPIYHSSIFSMGIFALRAGSIIPLHDHPDMYGVFKLIHGSLTLSNMSIKEELHKDIHRFVRVMNEGFLNLNVDSKPCSLNPLDGNIHEIKAGKLGAAFMDFLAPPYSDYERPCRFYKITDNSESMKISNEGDSQTLLKEIPCPSDYWCDTAAYTGPNHFSRGTY